MRRGMIFLYKAIAAAAIILGIGSGHAFAANGCDLNDPARDVARLFPGSQGYKAVPLEIQKVGGQKLLVRIESRLRDKLHGLYETIDEPYTIYEVFAGKKKVGYIHGVNQKGQYGGIQIFLALDLQERIKTFYIQKITGPEAGKFREAPFGKEFVGLSLADFDRFDVITGKGDGKVTEVKNPAPAAESDYRHIMRGAKKNLILVNEFIRMSPALSGKTVASAK